MRLLSGLLCAIVFSSACLAQETASQKPVPPAVQAGNAFAVDIYKKLSPAEGNLFFSPASIHTALAMTYAGAGGQTAKEMEKTLHLEAMAQGYGKDWKDKVFPAFGELMKQLNNPPKFGKEPPYQLVMANALWGQKGFAFKDSYLKLLDKEFEARLEPVDFAKEEAARKTINDWVAGQTKDKIKDLIPQGVLNDMTRLVLTNAIYFKSNWSHKFQKENTKDIHWIQDYAKALNSDAALPKVPMMNQQLSVPYMEDDTLQAVSLPYMGEALSMVIILPRKMDGLAAIEKDLSSKQLDKIIAGLAEAEVNVTMPKFTFSSQFSLNQVLAELGMADAFDLNKSDFSGMVENPKDKLFISAVIHKAFVAVDENGTEAAAATAVAMALAAAPMPQQPKKFQADHPFLFLIRHHESGEILFLGRVVDPKAK